MPRLLEPSTAPGRVWHDPRLQLLSELWDADGQLDWFAAQLSSMTTAMNTFPLATLAEVTGYRDTRAGDSFDREWIESQRSTAASSGIPSPISDGGSDPLDAAVAAQCGAEAIPDQADDVRKLVRHALASPSVVEAAACPHWREVYACTPIDGRLLEGYVDLLYRGPDGLVVVDHKTAATSDPDNLARRVDGYRLQGASYALTVAAATGEPVVRVTFLFLTPQGAFEYHLGGLDAEVAQVRGLVSAGHKVTTDQP